MLDKYIKQNKAHFYVWLKPAWGQLPPMRAGREPHVITLWECIGKQTGAMPPTALALPWGNPTNMPTQLPHL